MPALQITCTIRRQIRTGCARTPRPFLSGHCLQTSDKLVRPHTRRYKANCRANQPCPTRPLACCELGAFRSQAQRSCNLPFERLTASLANFVRRVLLLRGNSAQNSRWPKGLYLLMDVPWPDHTSEKTKVRKADGDGFAVYRKNVQVCCKVSTAASVFLSVPPGLFMTCSCIGRWPRRVGCRPASTSPFQTGAQKRLGSSRATGRRRRNP